MGRGLENACHIIELSLEGVVGNAKLIFYYRVTPLSPTYATLYCCLIKQRKQKECVRCGGGYESETERNRISPGRERNESKRGGERAESIKKGHLN